MTAEPEQPTQASAVESCIRCEYDLTGLPQDGVCPECGVAVSLSRGRSLLLRGADREWLKGVRRGLHDLELAMTIPIIGLGVLLGLVLITIAVNLVFGLADPMVRWPRLVDVVLTGAMASVVVVLVGLHIRGCFYLTWQTHPDYSLDQPTALLARACGMVLLAGPAVTVLFSDEIAGLARGQRAMLFLALQATAMAFFFGYARVLRIYEERTAHAPEDLVKRYLNVRKNLIGVVVLILLTIWPRLLISPAMGFGAPGWDWGFGYLGLTYMFFVGVTARVRRAVDAELGAGA